jgi:hypothetical protein
MEKNIFVLIGAVFFYSSVWAIKPCNNAEACEDRLPQCFAQSDLIVEGSLKKAPSSSENHFEIKIDKAVKGDIALLKLHRFEIGCWVGSDLSTMLGDVKIKNFSKFRFYMKPSKAEKSGFKIIYYEGIENVQGVH